MLARFSSGTIQARPPGKCFDTNTGGTRRTSSGIVVHFGAIITLPVLNAALSIAALVRPTVLGRVHVVFWVRHAV